ncbi:MAG: hypothetical protein WCK11_05100 [Candidatus Falkowbacteria bacterium]
MNQKIVDYLNQYKLAYDKDALVQQLSQVGYKPDEISEAVQLVYKLTNKVRFLFWQITPKPKYTQTSEKAKDFSIGFFAPIVVMLIFFLPSIFNIDYLVYSYLNTDFFSPIFSLVIFIFWLYAIVFFWRKRFYISLGLLIAVIGIPLITIIFLLAIFSGGGW